jgi:hypothetical protein
MEFGMKTVFDLEQSGYRDWWYPAIGLIGVVIAGLQFLRLRARAKRDGPLSVPYVWTGVVIAVVWTTGTFWRTYPEYRTLKSALESGRVEVVSGVVQHVFSLPGIGPGPDEAITVNGQDFSWSHAGPVREGQSVRITHVHGTIVRLEIRTSTAPSPQTESPAPSPPK